MASDPWEDNSKEDAVDPWDEPKKATKKESGNRGFREQLKDFDVFDPGLVSGIADLAGGSVGFVAGGAKGLMDVAAGKLGAGKPTSIRDALKSAEHGMEATMPSTYIDALKKDRGSPGYRFSQAPVELLGKALGKADEGVKSGAESLGVDPERADEMGAAAQAIGMLSLPFAGRIGRGRELARQRAGESEKAVGDLLNKKIPLDPWERESMEQPAPEGFAPEFRPTTDHQAVDDLMNDASSQRNRQEFEPSTVQGGLATETNLLNQAREIRNRDTGDYSAPGPIDFEPKPATTVTSEPLRQLQETKGIVDDPKARMDDRNFGEYNNPILEAQTLSSIQADGTIPRGLRQPLETIAKTSETPAYVKLANKLLEDKDFNADFKLAEDASLKGDVGIYQSRFHRAVVELGLAGNEQIILHEAMHARTYGPIQAALMYGKLGSKAAYDKMSAQTKNAAHHMIELFESVRTSRFAQHPIQDKYGMTNVHEFIAEAFTNPAFQADLAQLKLPKHIRDRGLSNYWDSFVDGLAKLFGFDREQKTYLSEVLRTGADLMNAGKNERIAYATHLDQSKDLGFGARINKKGPVQVAQEAAREFKLDPFEKLEKEVIPSLTKEGAKLEDFTAKDKNALYQVMMRMGSLVKENLLQDTTLGLIMREKAGTGPLIKWTVDQVSRIERQGLMKTKEAIDTALKPFRKMYHNQMQRVELREAIDTWFKHIGDKDLSRADFKTDRGFDIYAKFQAVHDKILGEVNDMREKAGFEPIQRIPSYFHAAWEGDYRVFAYKGDGTKVWAQGFKTEWQAKKYQAEYAKRHPELRVDPVQHVNRNKYGLNDLSAFEDAIRVMGKDDPVTKALQATYHDLLQHRGFGRTGVHRKGVAGFMGDMAYKAGDNKILGLIGMDSSSIGLKMMERSFDQYVNQAYRYIGNLEKQAVWGELQKVPTELRQGPLKETFEFLYSYTRKTQGKALDKMATDTFLEQISMALGTGKGLPQRAIRGVGTFASIYWLTTPRFIISQAVQSMNALPKLIQQHGVVDGYKVFFDGWNHAASHMMGLSKDPITEAGIKWASERGYLDPTIKNMISGDPFEIPIGSRTQALKEISSYPAAFVEHHLVRLPTFIMFEKGLRDVIKDKNERYAEAAEKTDYYMVNYARAHSPMLYDKIGLAGEAMRPLKQYSHNTWGQFLEYAKGVKDKGELMPLAHFLGVQASVAGLKGVLFVAEATAIVNAINFVFGTDIQTPEQLFLKSGLHDAVVYGGLSYALGMDVSSSVSAPSVPQLFSFPAVQFSAKLVVDVGTYLIKVAKGEETDQDRLKAAMAISPNVMHEWLRYMYTPQGGPTANPQDKDLRGNYRRSDGEWAAAMGLGAKPLPEAKVDAMMRAAKQELRRDMTRRTDALDAMVDQLMAGKPLDNSLLQKYLKEGGDPARMSSQLVKRMQEKMLTGPEREQGVKRLSPAQIHKLDVLRQYLDHQSPSKGMFDPDTGAVLPPRSDYKEALLKLAHHENSETVQDPKTGKWINIYGRGTAREGEQLPGSEQYNTVEEAERAARSRSSSHGPIVSDSNPPHSWYRRLPQGEVNIDERAIRHSKERIEGEYRMPQPSGPRRPRRIQM